MCETIGHRRLRAPVAHGERLIEPPLSAVEEMIACTQAGRLQSTYDFQGRSLAELSAFGRTEFVAAALNYTRQYRDVADVSPLQVEKLVIGGHQPELFHPGVWYKNFVLNNVAQQQQGIAVNMVIDSDTMKSASVKVPSGTVGDVRVQRVEFDQTVSEIPYEERKVVDPALFASFGKRLAASLEGLVQNPFVGEFWPRVITRAQAAGTLGEAVAQARHQVEGEWGQQGLELPQSQICRLEIYHWFTAHLLANLPRFWEIHNSALLEYRLANRVRSTAHPVPELATDQDWLEAPFWIWTRENPLRRRVFVREVQDRLQVTDRQGVHFELQVTSDQEAHIAVEQLKQLGQQGIKLRTRALSTTLLARVLLGDLFVHGIGGAKYDQLTDAMIHRFFGLQPPEFLAVSATLHLPIARQRVTSVDARDVQARLRELEFHPELNLHEDLARQPEVQQLLQTKAHWIAQPVSKGTGRQRCQAIRQTNAALHALLKRESEQLQVQREQLAGALRREKILSSREYAFCLYPKQELQQLMQSPAGF